MLRQLNESRHAWESTLPPNAAETLRREDELDDRLKERRRLQHEAEPDWSDCTGRSAFVPREVYSPSAGEVYVIRTIIHIVHDGIIGLINERVVRRMVEMTNALHVRKFNTKIQFVLLANQQCRVFSLVRLSVGGGKLPAGPVLLFHQRLQRQDGRRQAAVAAKRNMRVHRPLDEDTSIRPQHPHLACHRLDRLDVLNQEDHVSFYAFVSCRANCLSQKLSDVVLHLNSPTPLQSCAHIQYSHICSPIQYINHRC